MTDVGSGISGIRTSVPVPILPGKDRLAQAACQGDGGGTDCGLRSREIQDRSAGMSSSASFAPAGHRGPHHPVSAFVSTKRKKTEKPRWSYRSRCSILKRVFPTKVPSDSLGWIGSLTRTSDKSLCPMLYGQLWPPSYPSASSSTTIRPIRLVCTTGLARTTTTITDQSESHDQRVFRDELFLG